MKSLLRLIVFILAFLKINSSSAQLKSECQTCFDSEIVSSTTIDDQCTDYVIKVYYTGHCQHELSHFTVAIPSCYYFSNLENDLSCAQVVGYDPTTGLTGFKVDNIPNFGSSFSKSFLVSFRLCKNTSCSTSNCWSPVVAYKAGNCYELDSLRATCPALNAHLVSKEVSCYGNSDGQLHAIIDDGVSPYQYSWSNGATTASIQNISRGSYSVTITDATGSQVVLSSIVTQPDSIVITPTVVSATCNGKSDGSITLSVTGGNGPPYLFLWSNGATTSNLDSLSAGSYSVIVKDSLACAAQATFSIVNQKQISISAFTQLPNCNQSNGSIFVTVTGGSDPYQYSWSNGATSSSISDIASGTYKVIVTDAEGCSVTMSYPLHENNTLRISYTVSPTSCLDNNSGAIDVTVSGGSAPYSYLWSNGSTSQDISGLALGTYTVVVKDSLGCQTSARVSVFKKTFQVSPQITQPLCSGDSTGSISLSISGGVSPYKFLWSTGDTTSLVSNLASGIYHVTVTDSTGCSTLSTYSITSPNPLQATATIGNTSCEAHSIDLTPTGGTMPYQFLWSTGAITEDISGVTRGSYSVVITDTHGCALTKEVKIDSVGSFMCVINPLASPPVCLSANNKIFTSVSDASYQWQLVSTDGSWKIQTGASTDTLTFTAGYLNTSATVSLSVTKNNCTQSCTYQISTCNSSTTGGNNNENCKDCFKSSIVKTSSDETCVSYEVTVSTDGNCRYDLSHLVVAIPCGTISNYSDSGHWPLVIGKDPTTGLTGLKVDNVNNFGKTVGSFVLKFSVCYSSQECAQLLAGGWNPVVAYKAGQCVAYDTTTVTSGSASTPYPNPFKNCFSIDLSSEHDDVISVELYDQYGRKACEPYVVPISAGDKKSITFDGSALLQNIYLYKVKTRSTITFGRLLKE